MAITDINISEELETNAPSIKYSGNEGPKSPQEMQQKAEYDMQEYIIEFEDVFPEMKGLRGTEEYMEMLKNYFRELTKGPILPSPEDPVNPFGPKPIGPPLPDRQMAAYGGIMGMDGRRQYGIGSSLKKFARKIIPNEIAEIAVKAAPFVAPFNPLAAGLMSGIGSFDQTGRIGSSLKSGLLNYGLGQGARYLGGADFQRGINPFKGMKGMKYGFSSPTGEGGIKNLFKDKTDMSNTIPVDNKKLAGKNYTIDNETGKIVMRPGEDIVTTGSKIIETADKTKDTKGILKTVKDFAMDNKLLTLLLAKEGMDLIGGPEQTVSEIMARGDGMDVTAIRAEVQEAFQDSSGKKLAALRVKYPYLGRADTKDMTAMAADGGRIGFKIGGGAGVKLAELLAGKKITGSSRTFLEKIFGKEKFKEMATRDPDMHRGMLEVVEMFRNRDKEGLKMYLQKFLPHMDDEMVEDFIIGGGGTEGIQGQLIRLGSGRDYAGKLEMMKSADNVRKLSELDIKNMKPNAEGGRIGFRYGKTYKDATEREKFGTALRERDIIGLEPYFNLSDEELEALLKSIRPSRKQGRSRKQEGGLMDLGGMEKDYRAEGGFVPIGREEKADDVPARLSVNEFVFTADAVRNAGGGDIDKGAEVMENMMKNLEAGGQVSEESQGMAGAQQMFETSERLSEVM